MLIDLYDFVRKIVGDVLDFSGHNVIEVGRRNPNLLGKFVGICVLLENDELDHFFRRHSLSVFNGLFSCVMDC